LLISDSRFVKIERKVDARQKEMPIYQTVMDKIGKPIVFNICMLGALISITELVRAESVMKVLEKRIPSDFLEMNRRAMELGMDLGKQFKD
jgi:2-oxoglutarate ferredoxin oxidoreductase subunit gamma